MHKKLKPFSPIWEVEPGEAQYLRWLGRDGGSEGRRKSVKEPGRFARSTSAPNLVLRRQIQLPPAFAIENVSKAPCPRLVMFVYLNQQKTAAIQKMPASKVMPFLGELCPKNFSENNKRLTQMLLYEAVRWARNAGFSDLKLSSVVGIFILTHLYFCSSYWRNHKDVYTFFKECILLHAIMDPPRCANVFEAEECKELLTLMCQLYLPTLPLLRAILFPNLRLRYEWSPLPDPEPLLSQAMKKKNQKNIAAII